MYVKKITVIISDVTDRKERSTRMLLKESIGKREYLLHVLERDKIKYTVTDDGFFALPDDIDLDELAEDVACEEQRQSTEAKIPVYSKRTLENRKKFARLKAFYGKSGFHVLKSDKKACEDAGLI